MPLQKQSAEHMGYYPARRIKPYYCIAMIIIQKQVTQQTPFSASVSEFEPHNLNLSPGLCESSPMGQVDIQQVMDEQIVLSGGSTHWVSLGGISARIPAREYRLCGSNSTSIDIQEFQLMAGNAIKKWGSLKLKGVVGIINHLLYHWANCWGGIKKVRQKTKTGSKAMAIGCDREIVQKALITPAILNTSVSSTVGYLKRFWAGVGASCSRATVKRYTEDLREMGLLDYDSSFQSTGRARNRFYTFLDVPRLLLLAEAIINQLQHLEVAMPSHWGEFLGWLYDVVIPGWGWRRSGDSERNAPTTYEESIESRVELSHVARVEREEYAVAPSGYEGIGERVKAVSFRSALQHLDHVMELCNLKGINKSWHLRGSHLAQVVAQSRQWAVSKCRNDLDQGAVGDVCPMLGLNLWA